MLKVSELDYSMVEQIKEAEVSFGDRLKTLLLLVPQVFSLLNTRHTLPAKNIKAAFSFYVFFIILDIVSTFSLTLAFDNLSYGQIAYFFNRVCI